MSKGLEKIGFRIRANRKLANLSQQALAERAGVSYKYLGEIERGKTGLSVEILLKVSKALNLEPSEFLDSGEMESADFTKAKYILSRLSEKDISLALDILKALKKRSE